MCKRECVEDVQGKFGALLISEQQTVSTCCCSQEDKKGTVEDVIEVGSPTLAF